MLQFCRIVALCLLTLVVPYAIGENISDQFDYTPDVNDLTRVVVVSAVVLTEEGRTRQVDTWWMANIDFDKRERQTEFSAPADTALVTARGDFVISGYFHVDEDQTTWGSRNNPDLYIKVWHDVSGRIDVNCFHVSVPDIECSAELGNLLTGELIPGSQAKGIATVNNRFVQLTLQPGSSRFVLR